MRTYNNQISDDIIRSILTKDKLGEYKELTKKYEELLSKKRNAEIEVMNKLESRVIGELKGINFNYSEYANCFYVSFTDGSKLSKPRRWWNLWGRLR